MVDAIIAVLMTILLCGGAIFATFFLIIGAAKLGNKMAERWFHREQ